MNRDEAPRPDPNIEDVADSPPKVEDDLDPSDGRIRAVIREVTGRRSGGAKGLPLVHEMTIDADDGRVFDLAHPRADTEVAITARFLTVISDGVFAVCPICFTPNPTSREHVPQSTLGGQVMTRTCHRCNNGLGSALEAHLLAWYDNAFEAKYTSTEFQGERRGPRLLHRELPTGQFVLVQDKGRTDPEVVKAGMPKLEVQIIARDMRRVRLAALKHAYLAACLYFGGIPLTDSADRVRSVLIQAREAKRDEPLPESSEANALILGRTRMGAQGPPLALLTTTLPEGEERFMISLAGTLLVSWPFEDVHPEEPGLAKWSGDASDMDPTSTPRPTAGNDDDEPTLG